jgi:hypothetical protein
MKFLVVEPVFVYDHVSETEDEVVDVPEAWRLSVTAVPTFPMRRLASAVPVTVPVTDAVIEPVRCSPVVWLYVQCGGIVTPAAWVMA